MQASDITFYKAYQLGVLDAKEWAKGADEDLLNQALSPGQEPPSEGLINAVGFSRAADLLGVPFRSPNFADALQAYDNGWRAALAEVKGP